MKLFARPKCFSEAIAPVTTITCILGFRVFEYPRGNPRPVLSLMYLSFICIIFCNGMLRMHENYYANLKLMKLEYVLYQLLAYIFSTSVIIQMLLGWWHSKKLKICHKRIFELDETLRQLGLTVNYDGIYFVTIGTVAVWIIFVFTLCTTIFLHLLIRTDIFTSIYLIMIYIYLFTARIINVFEFYMFARYLKMKFELVNQLLRESLTDLSKKNKKLGIFEVKDYAKIMDAEQRKGILSTKIIFQWRQRMQRRINVFMSKKQNAIASQTKSHFPSHITKQLPSASQNQRRNSIITKCQQHKHVLKVIKQVHLELCKVSKVVCAIFGVQIAWEIGIIIIALTGALYNLYIRNLMNQHKVKGLVSQTILMLSMCALHTMKAVFLNRSCKSAADEGNRTTEIIRTIYDCDADIDMREEIQQFGIQILQSPMTFSVDGFTLDYRVLSMILKNVTTYMVIMVQVSNSLESNNAIEYSHF